MIDSTNMENMRATENQDHNNDASESAANSRTGKSRRGFAAMSPERQREIARQGGKAAHQLGVAHEWNTQEAREAGRKGGQNSRGGGRTKSRSDDIL